MCAVFAVLLNEAEKTLQKPEALTGSGWLCLALALALALALTSFGIIIIIIDLAHDKK